MIINQAPNFQRQFEQASNMEGDHFATGEDLRHSQQNILVEKFEGRF